jgi:glutathione synthase/RimK-type ligase-like ATP-grasp enzyme
MGHGHPSGQASDAAHDDVRSVRECRCKAVKCGEGEGRFGGKAKTGLFVLLGNELLRRDRRPVSRPKAASDTRGKPGSHMSSPVRVFVLTRDVHKEGKWVTSLVRALEERLLAVQGTVQVVSVEHTQSDDELLPACRVPQCDLLINRVSDAAPPATVKKTTAILRIFELHGIPVINGARCFAIGNNKVLHHQVLSRAGCDVPRSRIISNLEGDAGRFREAIRSAASALLDEGCRWPLIVKPNSGGFGEGVVPFASFDELLQWADDESSQAHRSSDSVTVLQEFLAPQDNAVYRVWFVRGKITAAVTVAHASYDAAALQGGCVGACSIQNRPGQPVFTAWDPPADTQSLVLRAAEIAEADCGSVELLYEVQSGRAIYFDLNMVSTLPERDQSNPVLDPARLWGTGWDFYRQLADHILARLPVERRPPHRC